MSADGQGPVSEREEILEIDMIPGRDVRVPRLLSEESLRRGRKNGGTIVVSDAAIVETDTTTAAAGISLHRIEMSARETGDMTTIAARGAE